jgi:hypothetical protein
MTPRNNTSQQRAAVDFITAPLWCCVGCERIDTQAAITLHLAAAERYANGERRPADDVVCFGAVLVGGQEWDDWMFTRRAPRMIQRTISENHGTGFDAPDVDTSHEI